MHCIRKDKKGRAGSYNLGLIFALISIVVGLFFSMAIEFFRSFRLPELAQIRQLVVARLKERTT